ncbi:MAG: transketolase family protein [Candidatus Gastranaerophilales bacterium]|nr:transketolase family protein [Candidatus Gastranaerophilales bacterium]
MGLTVGEKNSVRKTYGETLAELGKTREDIVVIDADLSCSTMTATFQKAFPERFFNAGIAEQDAICTAAGLATCGKTAFVSTFAMFATGRAYDQIRNTVAYSNLNVKIVATHAGVTVGEDGASHQMLEDIGLMRAIPNMVILVPSDSIETREMIKFAADHRGPVYVRLSRTNLVNLYDENTYKFEFGKAQIVEEGKDITIISNGETLIECINAKKLLKEKGVDAEVINLHTIKPLDIETIVNSAKKTNRVFTVENHSINNGLGSAVCEALSENYPCKVTRIGIKDVFGQSGEQRELMHYYRLTADELAEDILKQI